MRSLTTIWSVLLLGCAAAASGAASRPRSRARRPAPAAAVTLEAGLAAEVDHDDGGRDIYSVPVEKTRLTRLA